MECVLARGGTDGAEIRPCRREAASACRRRGARACPLPSRAELARTLEAVTVVEAAVHTTPLCAALLPDAPAESLDDALAVGRDAAAVLAHTSDPAFGLRGAGYRGGAFAKFFLQGTFGHGAAFAPLGDVVRALGRPTRAVTYAGSDASVYGVVGLAHGRALGLLLTFCPAP